VSALFPGYIFVRVEQLWSDIRPLPGVIKPVMSGDEPATSPTRVSPRSDRASGMASSSCRKKRLQPGDRVQIVSGLLAVRRGRDAGPASRRQIKVLLQLLGTERQAQLSPDAVEQI
jgi:transcriptional antiterminator RfaH